MSTISIINTRLSKYLKISTMTSLSTAVIFAFFMSFKTGLWHGIISGIVFGIILGIVMALFLVSMDYFYTRKLPDAAVSVYQEKELQLSGDIIHIYEICLNVLTELKYVKDILSQKEKLAISAVTKPTITSYGERISIHLETLQSDVINLRISSEPIIKKTLLDYGKNYNNVISISKQILRKL